MNEETATMNEETATMNEETATMNEDIKIVELMTNETVERATDE